MERHICLLSVGVVFLVLNNLTLAGEYCQDQHKNCDNSAAGIKIRKSQQLSDLSTDFEVGSQNFWMDDSPSQIGVRWKIEDINSSWELNNPAPKPPAGRNYMRVDRGATLSFGVAVLRSPIFQIPPSSYNDISMSFDFWIRSKWPQFTNLELYLNENGNERLLVSLWNYSDISNQNWVTYPISFSPLRSDSEFSLAFYAYCGTDVVDAVAIDNIRWIDASQTSTSSTVTESTTPTTASTFSSTTETINDEKTSSTQSTTTPIADCSSFFTATFNDINITSSSSPDFYEGNQSCYFVIVAPTPQGIVRLNFYDIDIPYNDTLKVYDGESLNSPVKLDWNGIGTTPFNSDPILTSVVFCKSGQCIIEHHSEPSNLPNTTYRGWHATYTVCGGSYIAIENKTTITSPNYPNFYYNLEVCYYNITALSPTGRIRFEIVDFQFYGYYDSLKVYDEMAIGSPILLSAINSPGYADPGNNLPATLPYSVNSSSPGILIRHDSQHSWGNPKRVRGWLATFVEIVD